MVDISVSGSIGVSGFGFMVEVVSVLGWVGGQLRDSMRPYN